jgi:hypothetical protein
MKKLAHSAVWLTISLATLLLTACGGGDPADTNHAPVGVDDAFTVAKNAPATTLDVLANDTDEDNDTLTIQTDSLTTPNHGGTVSIVSNKITYTPANGFAGTETFDYNVTDGNDSDTVTVTITLSNHAPVGVDDAFTTSRGAALSTLSVLANDTDSNGDTLSLVSVSTPDHGTATRSGNNIVYTPPQDYSGDATFTYILSDGTATATASVNVTIDKSWDSQEANVSDYVPTSLAFNNNGHGLVGIYCSHAVTYSDHSWSTPTPIGESGCGQMQLALNNSNQGVAIWQTDDGTQTDVVAIQYNGTSWDTTRKTIDYAVDDDQWTFVGISDSGDEIGIWQHITTTHYQMRSNHYTLGGDWNTTFTPISSEYQVTESPAFAMNPNGNAITAWLASSDGINFFVAINYYDAASKTWSGEQNISTNGAAASPTVGINDNGDVAVAWISDKGGGFKNVIKSRVFRASDQNLSEITDINIEINGTEVNMPSIGIDHARNVIVAWEQNATSNWDVYCNQYSEAGGWGTAQLLESSPAGAHRPRVAINKYGDALVGWEQYDATAAHANVRRFTASTLSWSPVQSLEDGSPLHLLQVYPAINDSGEGLVVWQVLEGGNWKTKAKGFW